MRRPRFVPGRMFFQVLRVIGQPHLVAVFHAVQRIGERHFTIAMMMPVRLAVRCDVNQLLPMSPAIECAHQPLREALAAAEQILKCHRLRHRPVIEEDRNGALRRKPHQVRPGGINLPAAHVAPGALAVFPNALCLIRRKDRKLDS